MAWSRYDGAMAAPLGILILDTRFPRLEGDIGNPQSFPFPVLYESLNGIGPLDAVRADAHSPALLAHLLDAGRRLAERGAGAISTSCGFLALFQNELARALPVPVFSSALLVVPLLARALGSPQAVGILTAEARSLTARHLQAVGADPDTPIEGMPEGGAFARTFLANSPDIDRDAVEREAVAAARRLKDRAPQIRALVLECTNLPPYRPALQAALNLPVHDIQTFLTAMVR